MLLILKMEDFISVSLQIPAFVSDLLGGDYLVNNEDISLKVERGIRDDRILAHLSVDLRADETLVKRWYRHA